MSEWKPGDVAMLDMKGYSEGAIGIWTGEFWAWSNGDGPYSGVSHCHRDVATRPLVVIDPEDREAVERLTGLYLDVEGSASDVMQAALREFANPTPPKPDEPTGLGAVVEDEAGLRWCRAHDAFWVSEDGSLLWDAMPSVVRVLSEGVQP